ncbi:hypothetical protein Slin15195_G062300 [Septoria linicola]|uniref:Uncharacterized protein n=1 Tax=Septoria linicola TaxID=215465 RepID=A0A9Q9AW50_9PEZI|nr:hypothetical protein Slin14017_G078110 [Septoria linicola]USW52911.1 hypothetical protein Slin15195_G062300 [Septoria linicola]
MSAGRLIFDSLDVLVCCNLGVKIANTDVSTMSHKLENRTQIAVKQIIINGADAAVVVVWGGQELGNRRFRGPARDTPSQSEYGNTV